MTSSEGFVGKAGVCLGMLSWRRCRKVAGGCAKWGVKRPASGFRERAGERLCRFLRGKKFRVRCLTNDTGSFKFGVGLQLAGIYTLDLAHKKV